MLNSVAEKSLARLLMVGSTFITIFVVWGAVTDPVNVTKLLALGGVAGAAITLAISFGARDLWANQKVAIAWPLFSRSLLLTRLYKVMHQCSNLFTVLMEEIRALLLISYLFCFSFPPLRYPRRLVF